MKKGFWKKVAWIGIPVAIQNLINTILNMCDTLMLTSLGEEFISSVGLANKIFFVFNLLAFGCISGCGILTSQYYGKGDSKGINKSFGFSLILSVLSAVIFFVPAIICPNFLLGLFTKSSGLIEIGGSYLRIVAISYIFTAISMSITGLLKSVNKTRAPMFVTLGCVVINVGINYLLIFGKLGFPRLEANGAAIGTVVARFIEVLALLIYLIFTKKDFVLKIKEMFMLDKIFIVETIKMSTPVIINEFSWGLGTTIYSVIYGHMDDNVVAAMTISSAFQDIAWAFLMGISNACAIIVGNELGANEFVSAKKTASRLLKTNVIISFIIGVVLLSTMDLYIGFYDNISDIVKSYIIYINIIFVCYLPFKAFNLTNVCGILRSGGDTVFCMLLDICGVWLIGIPLGLITAFGLGKGIIIVFTTILSEEIVKLFVSFHRYKKYKWVRNITHMN